MIGIVNAIPSENRTDPRLMALLDRAKNHVMTAAELREQRISYVWGMLPSSSAQTKDDVRKWLDEFEGAA